MVNEQVNIVKTIEEIINLATERGYFLISGSSMTITLHQIPMRFYRHGWQSWSLTTWLDPNDPVVPISTEMTRAKDEDIPYSLCNHPVGAWIGAIEMDDKNILLIGAMELSGRVEVTGGQIRGFYEDGHDGKWLVVVGPERESFKCYKDKLGEEYGVKSGESPRVWCSWYSLYNTINEPVIEKLIFDLGKLPFDVIQIDDGWQIGLGEWEANRKFPSGMASIAEKIHASGRKAGIWLAPFIVPRKSKLALRHPDWLLRNEIGLPVYAGIGWSGDLLALDSSHPEVLAWIAKTIERMLSWKYDYLKLDFLYAAAMPGVYREGIPRERAYRNAMQFIRKVAGEATYILACGAPIIPSLGICDGIRTGPDVAPFWQSGPMSAWLNNPSHPGTQNGIRTSLNRMWLKGVIHVNPDIVFFRSRNNHLNVEQSYFLKDLVRMSGSKSTSDLPQWLNKTEKSSIVDFLNESCLIEQMDRYRYRINDRIVDYSSIIILPKAFQFPPRIALFFGILQMGIYELLPGLMESLRVKLRHQVTAFFTRFLGR